MTAVSYDTICGGSELLILLVESLASLNRRRCQGARRATNGPFGDGCSAFCRAVRAEPEAMAVSGDRQRSDLPAMVDGRGLVRERSRVWPNRIGPPLGRARAITA